MLFSFAGSKERRDIIERIRKRGQFKWNSNFKLNRGKLSVSRRPNKMIRKNPWDLKTCANCKGTYASTTLRRHWKRCTSNSLKGEHIVHELGRAVEGRIHSDASDDLAKIFAKFRESECIRLIRFDWLVVCYGNELCLNYSPHFQEGYIRSKLRAAATLLRVSKSTTITDLLSSLYHVKNCNAVIEAIRIMGKFDPQTKLFGSPGTALTTVTLINTIGELLDSESTKLDDPEKERNVQRFLKVFKRDVRTKISKLAAISKVKAKRKKNLNIPTTADVNKLVTFLDSQRDDCFLKLSQKYSYEYWLKLYQLTMVTILVYNRRRAGEMQNITMDDFQSREIIASQCEMLLATIPEETKKTIKSRMLIRGKLDRTVPALLKHSWEDCIEILIRHRKDAGVSDTNDFLFSLPTQSGRIKTVNVWTIMRSFAVACGAQNPSSLRGTNLRKHMASFCATKNLNENDITNLADFMGHDDKIHRAIYRNNPLSSQLSQMASLLDAAQGMNSNTHVERTYDSDSSSDCSSECSSDSFEDQSEAVSRTNVTPKNIGSRYQNRKKKSKSGFIKRNVEVKGSSKRKTSAAPKMKKKTVEAEGSKNKRKASAVPRITKRNQSKLKDRKISVKRVRLLK